MQRAWGRSSLAVSAEQREDSWARSEGTRSDRQREPVHTARNVNIMEAKQGRGRPARGPSTKKKMKEKAGYAQQIS